VETLVQTFSDLVRDRLAALDLNAFSAETAAGLPADAIRNVLRSEKQAGPTLSRAKEICDALGLEISIVPKQNALQTRSNIGPSEDAPAGFVVIPWNSPRPGMGSAPFAFARKWLDQNNLLPDYLQAVIADVIELTSTPAKETVALLDTRIGNRKGHGLWCFRDSGKATIAHMTFQGDITIIYPANVEERPRIYEGKDKVPVTLQGKVVWMGQAVPLMGAIR
jgi:hypothetical protein